VKLPNYSWSTPVCAKEDVKENDDVISHSLDVTIEKYLRNY